MQKAGVTPTEKIFEELMHRYLETAESHASREHFRVLLAEMTKTGVELREPTFAAAIRKTQSDEQVVVLLAAMKEAQARVNPRKTLSALLWKKRGLIHILAFY